LTFRIGQVLLLTQEIYFTCADFLNLNLLAQILSYFIFCRSQQQAMIPNDGFEEEIVGTGVIEDIFQPSNQTLHKKDKIKAHCAQFVQDKWGFTGNIIIYYYYYSYF